MIKTGRNGSGREITLCLKGNGEFIKEKEFCLKLSLLLENVNDDSKGSNLKE